MSTYLPTLKQLQYLVALHEHGHFGRAADSCFVSQSTLSAGIAELERLVGVTLVERTKRSVRFTDLGEAFVARARPVVEASLALTEFAAAAAQPLQACSSWTPVPPTRPPGSCSTTAWPTTTSN